MKELSIEEKARRYDEILASAKHYLEEPVSDTTKNVLEDMFYELKENECIKKDIIEHIQKEKDKFNDAPNVQKKYESWIAWLEKQGKQKHADKVEPKFNFNVGQWIVATGKCTYLITKIDGFNVTLVDVNGDEYVFDASSLEDAHLWTVEDAKDGDVLSYRNEQWIFIYKKQIDNSSFHYYSLYSTIHQDLTIDDSAFTILIDEIVPATKEQRDLLFSKMKEEGYEWDADKKEPKKIEQKPADSIEPMFRVGDWVVNKLGDSWHINSVDKKNYQVSDGKGNYNYFPISKQDEMHYWSLDDAKRGDVLCDYLEAYTNPLIFILKKFEHVDFGRVIPSDYSSYCFLTAGDKQRFKEGAYHNKHNIKPATKKQRDFLFQKMKEAGYTFDFAKKELKKLGQSKVTKTSEHEDGIIEIPFGAKDSELQEATYYIPRGFHAEIKGDSVVIKKGRKKPTWSEEDEIMRIHTLQIIKKYWNSLLDTDYSENEISESCYNWLNSLKGIVQPKQEWSEEDEKRINRIADFIWKNRKGDTDEVYQQEQDVKWLKSLKLQNTWEPSDEQIKAIRLARSFVTDDFGNNPTLSEILMELEKQLQKIKEKQP